MGLLLEAVEVTGPLTWRWLLRDEETGNPLADHSVRLDSAGQELPRFRDLYGYERAYAAPDRWIEDGTRFTRLAGEWAGRELLGESVGTAILADAPVTVRVRVPAVLERVLLWPLELAHAGGRPLAAQDDVAFVYDIARDVPARRKAEVGETLRMLAVFSQPSRTGVLALRRERYALTRRVRQIAARERARIHLQVVQYGVTRRRLARIVEDGDGWDVLHISGHGTGGVLALEHEDGTPDLVRAGALVRLLRPARRRVKLAVVSACESAADTTAQTLRLLGLTEQAEELEATESGATAAGRASTEVPGLARALVRELDCAVVAMRYPVADEFAIAYGDVFYEHLFGRRQPADLAAAKALAEAVGPKPTAARPPLSLATPGVFGTRAVGLSLPVPRGKPVINPAEQRMAYFPGEPPRFVGRAAAMARATAALAPDSGLAAVLLHGMAGSGKTTCAMELAYRNEERFGAAAFWQAPTKDGEWHGALENLASRLETQLGDYGFAMTGYIGTVPALEAFLPRLRQAMENSGILLVLDNLETLLTPEGGWRDPRMTLLMTALTSHNGESRVILTSRIVPAGLGPEAVRLLPDGDSPEPDAAHNASDRALTLPVHALSLQESIALARELPHLRKLLHADTGAIREPDIAATSATNAAQPARPAKDEKPFDPERMRLTPASPHIEPDQPAEADRARLTADRTRVLRVLRVVQGHPKLMELADAAAADRTRLDTQLAAAEEAAAGQGLAAFFRDGASTLDPGEFLTALKAWTVTALGALSPQVRLMAEFVACLEDGDRRSDIIESNWADLWQRLERPGDPPAPEPLLSALARAALVEVEPVSVTGTGDQTGMRGQPTAGGEPGAAAGKIGQPGLVAYRVHPGVAAAITAQAAQAAQAVREAADAGLAAFWAAVSEQAREREGGEDSGGVVRAGLAAAPYLLRCGDWDTAAVLLEHAVMRDRSPGTVQAVLPSLRRIAAATGAPKDAAGLARVLAGVDPDEAERLLRGAVDTAAGASDYRVASVAAGQLVALLMAAGRLAEALAVADQKADFTERARLGPWTRLADQARRLQVLGLMGEHERVLAETETLRAAMTTLPARGDASETANPWNVRETILNTGWFSALATRDWQRCLDLNAEIAASERERGAGVHEVTRFRFNDAGPLIELGRLGEAGRLLAECQRVFEDHADTPALATVLSARASLEDELGHRQAAADLERAALRLRYARPEPRNIAIGHHNLAIYLGRLDGNRAGQRAHRLAAALIYRLSGMAHDLADTVGALAEELRGDDPAARLPATVAQVVATAELTEGVRLGALLAALQPDPRAVEDALADILRTAAAPETPARPTEER
jgi:tetratricopeptide (TPR) repeat protein